MIWENDPVGMNTNQTVGHREPPGTSDAFRQQAVF
jgi:hypothetical protein